MKTKEITFDVVETTTVTVQLPGISLAKVNHLIKRLAQTGVAEYQLKNAVEALVAEVAIKYANHAASPEGGEQWNSLTDKQKLTAVWAVIDL